MTTDSVDVERNNKEDALEEIDTTRRTRMQPSNIVVDTMDASQDKDEGSNELVQSVAACSSTSAPTDVALTVEIPYQENRRRKDGLDGNGSSTDVVPGHSVGASQLSAIVVEAQEQQDIIESVRLLFSVPVLPALRLVARRRLAHQHVYCIVALL